MPELPDVEAYLQALRPRVIGHKLLQVSRASPFILRTALPPISTAEGREVVELRRLGKRIAIGFEDDHWLILHLMIAGRLHWLAHGAKRSRAGRALATFEFDNGALTLTEAGTQRRASLHVVRGEEGLRAHERAGLQVFEASPREFAQRLRSINHTLKRALTDPQLFSGIGNAYSDEILHAAKLSPVALTQKLTDEEVAHLHAATVAVLTHWIAALRAAAAGQFPEGVTAFREGFAVHGRFGKPCPVCATKVQRIRYASNETNYCPRCQTAGRITGAAPC